VSALLDGKVAIVTGAAQGLGRATALAFAEHGARVVLADIDTTVEEVAKAVSPDGTRARHLVADLTREDAAAELVAIAERDFGQLDVLVNNAGITQVHPVADTSLDEWNRTVAINLTTQFLMLRQAIAAMRRAGGGSVVNIGSISSLVGLPDQGAYAPAKAGVLMLTRQAAVDYGRDKIRVNAISAGPIRTLAGAGIGDARAMFAFQQKHSPLGRGITLEELGGAALYLLSDLSTGTTGEIHFVDSGYNVIAMPHPDTFKGQAPDSGSA